MPLLGLLIFPNFSSLLAQEDEEVYGSTVDLEVFNVPGYRSGLAKSAQAKKDADQVIDTITAEEIGQFPDLNVAEAIQRITGVAMTRNNGEGEKVSVRGLNPNFTRVEVDGRSSMVTVDDSSPERDAQLSVFNSDLYQSIEVIKSPSARDVEGGVGGTVRLNTFDPLDIGGLSYGFDTSWSTSEFKDKDEWGISGFFSDTFVDGKLGVLIHGTYEVRNRRLDKIESNPDYWFIDDGNLSDDEDPAALALVGAEAPGRTRYFSKNGDNPRTNFNAKLQWRPSDELEFYLGGLFTYETRDEERSRIQMTWSRGDIISGVVDPETNTLVQAVIDRHRLDQDALFRDTELDSNGITGGFIWDNDLWRVSGEFSFADGAEDWFQSQALARVNRDGEAYYDMRPDFRRPEMFTPGITRNPEDISLRTLRRQHRIIGYDEDVFRLDVVRQLEDGFFTSVEAGLRLTDNKFHRTQGDSDASVDAGDVTFAMGDTTSYGLQDDLGFGEGPSGMPRRWAIVSPDSLIDQYPLEDDPIPFNNNQVYQVDEKTSAAYLMANFQSLFDGFKAQGNIGVRVVKTEADGVGNVNIDLSSDSVDVSDTVLVGEPTTLSQDYTEALPSFNLVLAPTNKDADYLFRGAISKALTRPTIREMRPQIDVDVNVEEDPITGALEYDGEIERGNPSLDPFSAWQYDLGFEYYFGENSEGLFSITGFVKEVESFIADAGFTETIDYGQAGIPPIPYQVTTHQNGGDADIQGVEISLQSPFTFLPDFWSNFGGMLNYTYIDSEFIDENGNTNPFPGTSENTFNAILFYESGGFSTRFAYNYRDDFLREPDLSGRNQEFVEGSGRLDIGVRYRWESGWKLAIDAINVTEEDQYHYFDVPTRLVDYTFETMIINVSMGYKF